MRATIIVCALSKGRQHLPTEKKIHSNKQSELNNKTLLRITGHDYARAHTHESASENRSQ